MVWDSGLGSSTYGFLHLEKGFLCLGERGGAHTRAYGFMVWVGGLGSSTWGFLHLEQGFLHLERVGENWPAVLYVGIAACIWRREAVRTHARTY